MIELTGTVESEGLPRAKRITTDLQKCLPMLASKTEATKMLARKYSEYSSAWYNCTVQSLFNEDATTIYFQHSMNLYEDDFRNEDPYNVYETLYIV